MEKVWAKLHGSYNRIIGGQCRNAFRDLTGAPAWEFKSKPDEGPDNVWDRIAEGEKNDFIMSASVSESSPEEGEALKKMGLVGQHAYGLLSCAIVKDKKKKDVRLVQLRNPWGHFEWNGNWGDKSSCWTPEAKKQVNFKDEDDGTFWMEFEEFRKYFTRI